MASLDRSEYEEIIKALKNFILEEQKKIIPQRKTEVQTSPQTVNSRKPLNYNIGFSWKPLKGK